ncbi:uncharacterized protein LOC143251206 [Tachypleus tridentatus]|uniref:uncharacterized protein LOC143251206 n=1 Tax=Tachypleus tridentatus TaxID=6853 RepID=UPI003FD1491F
MKPFWALFSLLLVVSTAVTSASENEAEETLVGGSGYMMAYPMEEKMLEDNTALESSGEPALAKSQDKDKIDETLLLLLPSEGEDKNKIESDNDKESVVTEVNESMRSVLQDTPSRSMPPEGIPHVEIQQNIRPKEEDLQKMLYSREQPFSHKSKPTPDEKPESLQFTPSRPKFSPKRPPPFLQFLFRNNFSRFPMGRPNILHKGDSLVSEGSSVIGNGIDGNRAHREPDNNNIIIDVIGNGDERQIKSEILPFGFPRPLPIENQQYPLLRSPFSEEKARTLLSPKPQMLSSISVPEIHMNQEGPARPLLPLTPFMLIYSNMLLNSPSPSVKHIPLLPFTNAHPSSPRPFLPSHNAPLPQKNIPLLFPMASLPPSDTVHPYLVDFLPHQNGRFQSPVVPIPPSDFSPRPSVGPLPSADAPFPPLLTFQPLPNTQFPLPIAPFLPPNIPSLPSMAILPPPDTPLPIPMPLMPPRDTPFPSPMAFMPPQDTSFPSPMAFMPPRDFPFPSPMPLMPPRDIPFPSPMPLMPPRDTSFPSPIAFMPPRDIPFPSPMPLMPLRDTPFSSPMTFMLPRDTPFSSPMTFMPPRDTPFPSPMPFLPLQNPPYSDHNIPLPLPNDPIQSPMASLPYSEAPLIPPISAIHSPVPPLERIMFLLHPMHAPSPVSFYPEVPRPMRLPTSFGITLPNPSFPPQTRLELLSMDSEMEDSTVFHRPSPTITEREPRVMRPPLPPSQPQYFQALLPVRDDHEFVTDNVVDEPSSIPQSFFVKTGLNLQSMRPKFPFPNLNGQQNVPLTFPIERGVESTLVPLENEYPAEFAYIPFEEPHRMPQPFLFDNEHEPLKSFPYINGPNTQSQMLLQQHGESIESSLLTAAHENGEDKFIFQPNHLPRFSKYPPNDTPFPKHLPEFQRSNNQATFPGVPFNNEAQLFTPEAENHVMSLDIPFNRQTLSNRPFII